MPHSAAPPRKRKRNRSVNANNQLGRFAEGTSEILFEGVAVISPVPRCLVSGVMRVGFQVPAHTKIRERPHTES